jgi:hypothetical protein
VPDGGGKGVGDVVRVIGDVFGGEEVDRFAEQLQLIAAVLLSTALGRGEVAPSCLEHDQWVSARSINWS